MDIFTTALTRVVPVPIKPASLKVKALLKEAGTSKLKEDPDHLENHDYYFNESEVKEKQESDEGQQEQSQNQELTEQSQSSSTDENNSSSSSEEQDESKKTIKHLDLYV